MNTRVTVKILVALILLAVAAGLCAYPMMADRIATHWNAQGIADGYSGRFFGVFLMPMVMLGLVGLYVLIPAIDPLRKNIEGFRRPYNLFWVVITGFMLYVHLLTLKFNTGSQFDFGKAMLPGLALVFYATGVLIQHAKRSWFVGIRTPWTMSDDVVWDRTHALGGTLFKASAVLALVGLLFDGEVALWFVLVPVLASALIAIVYSYVIYRRLHR